MKPEYASYRSRISANLLDQIIIGVPVTFIAIQIFATFVDVTVLQNKSGFNTALYMEVVRKMILLSTLIVILWSLTCAFFVNGKKQATPGKRIMGIYITNSRGEKANFGNLFARFASLPLAILMFQFFERKALYAKLDEIETKKMKFENFEEYVQYINSTPASSLDLIILFLVFFWLILPLFTKEKTAFHDILFDTRVVRGRK